MHDNPAVRNFNPHSRVGSDHGRQKEADRISNFNPHSHEGATIYGAPCKITVQISIHTPTRERHKVQIYHATDQIISIHTPTRERRSTVLQIKLNNSISIHTPTRGATTICQCTGLKDKFQSTLPRGERQPGVPMITILALISIHTPTRGATATPGRVPSMN